MKKPLNISVALLVAIFSFSCFIPANNPDPFYSAWKDWGGPRFPLIYPYDVFYIGGSEKWTITLHSHQKSEELHYYQSINDVDKIFVANNVIMIHSSYEEKIENNNLNQDLSWFVFVPNEEIEKGFEAETDFLKFIDTYGIVDLKWETPDILNRKFLDTGCLEWIPGCG
jgi:hypothetical protein